MKRRAMIILSFMAILTVVVIMATRMAWATVLPTTGPMVSPQREGCYNASMALIDDRKDCTQKTVITEPLREYRDFVDQDGKTVNGKVMAYNPDRKVVTLAKKNGNTSKVGLSILSKADQAYIREWHIIESFFMPSRFRISAHHRLVRDKTEHFIWRPEEPVVFDITLENRCDFDMKNLALSYRIRYRVCEPNLPEPKPSVNAGSKGGLLIIKRLDAGECTQVETPPLLFPKEDLFEYYKGGKAPPVEFQAIRIRICLSLERGRTVCRECSCTHRNWKAR